MRPSGFAPKRERLKVRLGKRGGLMRASSDGKTVCQGSVEAVTRRGARAMAAALKQEVFDEFATCCHFRQSFYKITR